MTERFPRDRFDDVTEGPRVGAHRGPQRRGRGWLVFAWAALATGVLVGIGVLALGLLTTGLSDGNDSGGASTPTPSASASASAPATSSPSASPSTGSGSGTGSGTDSGAAATPAQQGTTTVVVLNGTTTTGLAGRASTALAGAGWKIASTGDAGTTGTTQTVVYYRSAASASVAQGIAKSLGTTAVQQSAAFPNADVSVVLGSDYTG